MGDPRYVYGFSYEVGTCRAGGFDARPSTFVCPVGNKIQSYCDSADPYCCNGNDANVHQGYGSEYGQAALTFIKSKLSSSGGSSPTTTTQPTTTGTLDFAFELGQWLTVPGVTTSKPTTTNGGSTGGSCAALYGQCGGQGYNGPTCCSSGTCKASNQYYSQCL